MPEHTRRSKGATKKKGDSRKIYSATIVSDISFVVDQKTETVNLMFWVRAQDSRYSFDGTLEAERAEDKNVSIPFPMDIFKDSGQCEQWASKVRQVYHDTLSDALMGEAGEHLNLVTNLLLNDLNIARVDIPALIDEVAERRAMAAKRSLHLPMRGRYSQWTATELTLAVRAAIDSIPKHEKQDYDNVAARLQVTHPDKAPKTGDALRKLVGRLNLKWKDLKSGQ
ncbi:MAG: hypothetical protein M3362_25775 [Acidobacteriota bacterium]|nr:hypothetical protein [Acidobacteriota bacterium]